MGGLKNKKQELVVYGEYTGFLCSLFYMMG